MIPPHIITKLDHLFIQCIALCYAIGTVAFISWCVMLASGGLHAATGAIPAFSYEISVLVTIGMLGIIFALLYIRRRSRP